MSATSIVAIIEPSSIGEVRAGNRDSAATASSCGLQERRRVRAGKHDELLHS
jgi:hypothetical protein